jgi:hypothetical protein
MPYIIWQKYKGKVIYFYVSQCINQKYLKRFPIEIKKKILQFVKPVHILQCTLERERPRQTDGIENSYEICIVDKKKKNKKGISLRYRYSPTYIELNTYDIPKRIFSSYNLSKKYDLLIFFNEYVKTFGNIDGVHHEEYFVLPAELESCEYDEYDNLFRLESSCIKIIDNNKMKIFIEVIKTLIKIVK